MSLPHFTWTDRARPFMEIGVGDSRIPSGQARWDVARWDAATSKWAGSEPTWLDYSCETFAAEFEYGRATTTDRFVPGQLTVEVDNRSGWADPNANVNPSSLSMRPGRAIRVGVDHAIYGRVVLFRGFIDAMRPTYVPADRDHVTLSCVDALGEVNRAKFAGQATPIGAGETVTARVTRILALANWPTSKQVLGGSSTPLVGDELNGQAADLLGRAADSEGGSIFGDRDANLVYRPRDWQTFANTTPVDGTIGNVNDTGQWIPGTPAADGYLASSGSVSTQDSADMTITAGQRVRVSVVARFDAMPATGNPPLVTKQGIAGVADREFALYTAARRAWGSSANSAGAATAVEITTADLSLGVVHTLAYEMTHGSTTGAVVLDGVRRAVTFPTAPSFRDTSAAVVIGGVLAGSTSRIYSAALERLDASGNVTSTVWRFDANEYPGGPSFLDPRGRTWYLSGTGVVVARVPAVPPRWIPADVCPIEWVRPFDRADIATRAIFGRDAETAVVVDDLDGQVVYGIEPFDRTDLWTQNANDLTLLANRALSVRSWRTAPTVKGVSLDARTDDDALDLMTLADPYKPSRYRCRLLYDRGLVFDGEYLVTGVVHQMTPNAWTLSLQLDSADPYRVAANARWDSARWDRALWSVAV